MNRRREQQQEEKDLDSLICVEQNYAKNKQKKQTQSIHWSPGPRPGRGSASVPHLWLSQPVAILMNRPH